MLTCAGLRDARTRRRRRPPRGRSIRGAIGKLGARRRSMGSQISVSTAAGETSVARTPLPRVSSRSTSCSARSAELAGRVGGVAREDRGGRRSTDRHDVPAPRSRIPGGTRASAERRHEVRRQRSSSKSSGDMLRAVAITKDAGVVHDNVRRAADRASDTRQRSARDRLALTVAGRTARTSSPDASRASSRARCALRATRPRRARGAERSATPRRCRARRR